MNARYEVRRWGRGAISKEVVLQSRPSSSVREISLAQELLAICFVLLGIQLKTLSLDILFGGELGTICVNVGNDSSVSELDKSIIDKVTVD